MYTFVINGYKNWLNWILSMEFISFGIVIVDVLLLFNEYSYRNDGQRFTTNYAKQGYFLGECFYS